MADWIDEHAKQRLREEIVVWNNHLRDTRFSDLPPETQVYTEDYIAENLPADSVIYQRFDVYDLE